MEWVKALKALMASLADYVRLHHAVGPSWNAEGIPLSSFKGRRPEPWPLPDVLVPVRVLVPV